MPDSKPFSCCSWCGARFTTSDWPRTCAACAKTTWRNPLPVAVLVVPVDGGVLAIRRDIEPHIGSLALPGGFVNYGESWQTGAARELFEETQIKTDPNGIRVLDVKSAPDSTILIFGEAAPMTEASLPPFTKTDETSERVVLKAFAKLAFPLHEQVLASWFAKHAAKR